MSGRDEQIARVWEAIDGLRRERVTYRSATVTAVHPIEGTFDADVEGAGLLEGIPAPQLRPKVGDVVQLDLFGATPIFRPNRVGEGTIGRDELDDEVSTDITVALDAANGKNKVTYSTLAPSGSGTRVDDSWFQLVDGVLLGAWRWDGDSWEQHTYGDAMFDTISAAKLVTGTLAAGVVITVGDPNGKHTLIGNGELIAKVEDPVDGIPNEVARFGRNSGGSDPVTGQQTWTIGEDGRAALRGLNVTEDPVFQGKPLSQIIDEAHAGDNQAGWIPEAAISGVTTEIGLFETVVRVRAGNLYLLIPDVPYNRTDAGGEVKLRVRDGGTGIPQISSPLIYVRQYSGSAVGFDTVAGSPGVWVPTVSGDHRLLVTAERGGSGVINITAVTTSPSLFLLDLGPAKPILASVNRGGGSTAPPVQQYDTGELAPAGWATFRGDGVARGDVGGPVQGWDPSGTNGDGKGYWYWNLPSITGTVDRVDLYLYSEHWYYNSGGTAILNILPSNQHGSNFGKAAPAGDHHVGGYPKPGGKWISLPSGWNPYFHNNGAGGFARVNGITVGPSGGTNLAYYGRFSGAAARLRLWYTQ